MACVKPVVVTFFRWSWTFYREDCCFCATVYVNRPGCKKFGKDLRSVCCKCGDTEEFTGGW